MKRLFFFLILLTFALVGQEAVAQEIRSSSYGSLATVASDGTVRDANNRMVARIYGDGTVRDGMNRTIGSARGVKRTHAAVFFFFNMF